MGQGAPIAQFGALSDMVSGSCAFIGQHPPGSPGNAGQVRAHAACHRTLYWTTIRSSMRTTPGMFTDLARISW